MLDAEADRERLGFEEDALVVKHLEGVASAVTDGEDDVVDCECRSVKKHHAFDAPFVGTRLANDDALDARAETEFATERFDLRAQQLDHGNEAEGADMRLGSIEDVVGRSRLDELVQDFAAEMARVFYAAIELAVGECAGAAFAELGIRLRIELTL